MAIEKAAIAGDVKFSIRISPHCPGGRRRFRSIFNLHFSAPVQGGAGKWNEPPMRSSV